MSDHPYHTVLVDANVWYSRTLRDWVCMLATEADGDLYTVLWTDDILAECTYHLRKANPRWEGGQISRIRESIEEVFPDGRVRDFVVEGGALDEGDQHVHAAAVAGGADLILTMNVEDFPGGDECPYEVYTPGEFFTLVWDSAPGLVERVCREMDRYWSRKGTRTQLRSACGARRRAPRCRSSPGGPPGSSVIADGRPGPRPASFKQSRSSTCSGAGRQPPCDHPFRGPRHSTSGLPPPAEVLSERAASADRAASAGRGARGPRRRRSGPVPAPGLAKRLVSHYAH